LKEIPKKILKDLDVVKVEHMDEVLREALVLDDPSKLFRKEPKRPTDAGLKKKEPEEVPDLTTH
jgi:ATP-dependent Lon protease